MIKTCFVSSTSACFEWQNDLPYYFEGEYTVLLNGAPAFCGRSEEHTSELQSRI